MPRIHSNNIIYYCIVKNKILRKYFIFFVLFLATPHIQRHSFYIMRHRPE
jgi:hypothetical protein